jgi:hypothetical protein
MIIILIVAVIGIVITTFWAIAEDYDRGAIVAFGFILTLVATFLAALLVDGITSRAAFAAETACMVKRQQPVRQTFTTNVICVPASRDTRNDTTTVNLRTEGR